MSEAARVLLRQYREQTAPMEMHQIRYFLAVQRLGNFTRAAALCNITQPALTRAVRKLEDEVGGSLFSRRPGAIELTELGRVLSPRFDKIADEAARARLEARTVLSHRSQRLRIGVMSTLAPDTLVGTVRGLQLKLPRLEIEFVKAKTAQIIASLGKDEIDVGFAAMPQYPDDVETIALWSEPYVVMCPSDHRLAAMATVPLSELRKEPLIERLDCEFRDHVKIADASGWPPITNARYRIEREDWVMALICAGLGVAIMPASAPMVPGVVQRPLSGPAVHRVVSLVTARSRAKTTATQELMRLVRCGHSIKPPAV